MCFYTTFFDFLKFFFFHFKLVISMGSKLTLVFFPRSSLSVFELL